MNKQMKKTKQKKKTHMHKTTQTGDRLKKAQDLGLAD